jgi:hypothetical protein
VRGVPTDLKLRLGLDASLGNEAERVRTALQAENRVETLTVNQENVVDYVFGRMTEEYLQQAGQQPVTNPPPIGSLGLFTAGLTPVSESFGEVGESIDAAVNRLRSRLKLLLAGRVLRLILNSDASELKVATTVAPLGGRGIPNSVGSRGAQEAAIVPKAISTTAQTLTPGTQVQVKVQNNERKNLYIGVLVIGSNGDIIVLFPADWEASEEEALVSPGQTLIAPPEDNEFKFIVQGPSGFLELLVLASTEPLRDALRGLQQIAKGRGTRSGDPLVLDENEPVEVMEALLGDLDRVSRAGIVVTRGVQAVDTTQLAAISAVIEVVES